MRTLDGYLVIDLSLNLPGPLATARLAEMGARVVKVEPPGGDPAERFSAPLYSELNDCKEVVRLDLKTEPDWAADGWVALGALEDRLFRTRGVDEWQGLALEHSLALEKVKV